MAAAAAPFALGRRTASRAPALALVATVVGAVFALPLAYLVVHVAGLGGRAVDIWRIEDATAPLLRTVRLAVAVGVGTTVVGTGLAWLVTRTDLPGRRVWRVLVPLPLVVPSYVGALALIAAFAPGGLVEEALSPLGVGMPRTEGFWAATVVLILLTYPYVYLPVAARLASLPASLEESARALGHSPAEVFRTVVLPQTRGAMWAGSLLVFLYTLSEFGAVQLLHYDTLTRAIFAADFDRDVRLVLSLVLAVVALAVVVTERRVARRRLETEAMTSGRPALRAPLGRWKLPALVATVLVVVLALVVPVAVLAHWTIRGALGSVRLDAANLVGPATTTAALGVLTAAVALTVMLPVAYATTRYHTRVGEVANAFVVSGFALPGIVISFAVVGLVLRSSWSVGLYQTPVLLVGAYVVHFGSQALRAAQVAVGGVPPRVDDAARALGAGRVRRLVTVQLPLMRAGLAAGGGLVLLSTMKELPATLILAPPGTETLATRVWGSTNDLFYAEAGLAALVLVALSGVLTYVLTVRPAAAVVR